MNILNRERQKSLYFCCDLSVHASSFSVRNRKVEYDKSDRNGHKIH